MKQRKFLRRALGRLTDPGSQNIWTPSIVSDNAFLPRTDRRVPKPRR
jgi:hypothetical protein